MISERARAVVFVRRTMLAGAIYDILFAVPIATAPGWLSGMIGVPMPDQEVYLRFLGVFLLGLAGFYLQPVFNTGRYLGNVAVAAALRAAGGIFMFAGVLAYHQPRAFLLLGAGDLAFAVVHFLSLAPFTGWRFWRAASADSAPGAPSRGEN